MLAAEVRVIMIKLSAGLTLADLLPSFSTSVNLVKSVLEKENGREEAIY
jgi:hypothetical protein